MSTRFRRRISSRLRQERGTALVEFAIVLPVLMLIILGILQFGRYESYSNQATQLAEEAARWAAVNVNPSGSTTTTLQSYVQKLASPELQAGSSDVTTPAAVYLYYPTGSSNSVGNPVRACVTATVKVSTPLFSSSYQIVQSATMRIEQARTTPSGGTGWNTDTAPSACPTS